MMKRSDWLTALTAALVGLTVFPATAMATSELTEVCHQTSDAATADHEWIRIRVSERALEGHLGHGDGSPGDEVETSGGLVALDENCVADTASQPPGEPPTAPGSDDSPSDAEVFAIAYSDVDGTDGYNADMDVLIAKLIDGPGAATDGVAGPGDLIIANQYPKDFAMGEFNSFTVIEHTVTELEAGDDYVCNVSSSDQRFVWSSGEGNFDLYEEWTLGSVSTRFHDRRTAAPIYDDELRTNPASPSQPTDDLDLMGSTAPENHSFIEVQADCLP